MRKGFGLIQALIVIVLISTILVIAMKYAQITTRQTIDLYARERAELFMDEAIELTLLAISGYDRNATKDCLRQVNFISEDRRFDANVTIRRYYLFNGLDNDVNLTNCFNAGMIQAVQTEDSHGMVLLEATVETNSTNPRNKTQIRIHRRTLQHP
jgi:hypothetical protein